MIENFEKNITIVEKRLTFIRKLKGFSQKELASILNVSRSVINDWENGYADISLKQLVKLTYFYQIPIDYFLGLITTFDKVIYNFIPELNLETLGKNIKKIRIMENMSQEKFASQINSSHANISNYEKGKFMISTANLKDICNTFGYSADWCVGNTKNFIKRKKKITIKEDEIRLFIEN